MARPLIRRRAAFRLSQLQVGELAVLGVEEEPALLVAEAAGVVLVVPV